MGSTNRQTISLSSMSPKQGSKSYHQEQKHSHGGKDKKLKWLPVKEMVARSSKQFSFLRLRPKIFVLTLTAILKQAETKQNTSLQSDHQQPTKQKFSSSDLQTMESAFR